MHELQLTQLCARFEWECEIFGTITPRYRRY